MEKTYWLITIENEGEKSGAYTEADGPIFKLSDFVSTYGEKAVILFCMQLTKEQYEHFKG